MAPSYILIIVTNWRSRIIQKNYGSFKKLENVVKLMVFWLFLKNYSNDFDETWPECRGDQSWEPREDRMSKFSSVPEIFNGEGSPRWPVQGWNPENFWPKNFFFAFLESRYFNSQKNHKIEKLKFFSLYEVIQVWHLENFWNFEKWNFFEKVSEWSNSQSYHVKSEIWRHFKIFPLIQVDNLGIFAT